MFSQYNEVQLDPTNSLVIVDQVDQVAYVKHGRKTDERLRAFVDAHCLEVLYYAKYGYKTANYDDFRPRLLKYLKVAELPYKQDAPASILEAWRVDVAEGRVSLRYTFNLQ